MLYPEWQDKILMVDLHNSVAKCYKNPNGSVFYVEPGFYRALQALHHLFPERYPEAVKAVEVLASRNKVTVFAGEKDNPLVDVPKAVVLSVVEIMDYLGIQP